MRYSWGISKALELPGEERNEQPLQGEGLSDIWQQDVALSCCHSIPEQQVNLCLTGNGNVKCVTFDGGLPIRTRFSSMTLLHIGSMGGECRW
ncbi:uncharacterized protein LOC125029445 isoform X2 [Penaeus chinensis]|uniref:uncharacterized protein LOC125029445 isoform X2 n=1 Tax=Penaeus chinensis TaxID=139456 RepID=UPI001FB59FE7|nr:uncharacterized protein LOC125029445 isoform X2 [Penaeus chinensis]